MLARRDPYNAYQRVEFDARVQGASSSELVHICYDQLVLALSTALLAQDRWDFQLRSQSLTRALTALMALQLGIDQGHAMAGALTFGQSEDTCVVYGMPKVAFNIGAVRKQAALHNMAAELFTALKETR